MSQLLAHKKIKRSLVELLTGPLRDYLSRRGFQFVVAEHFITYHSTHGETTNNHEEADTLFIHCIKLHKVDVDVAVLLIGHRHLLRCRNVYFGVSVENYNTDSLLEFLGSDRAKYLLTLHYLNGCNTVGKFYNHSKEPWPKLFLQIKYQDVFKAFESLHEKVMPKTIDHLANFVCWGSINTAKHPNLTTLAEVQVPLYKHKNASCEKMPSTMGSFYNHILRIFHHLR